jgi:hypothetical protein
MIIAVTNTSDGRPSSAAPGEVAMDAEQMIKRWAASKLALPAAHEVRSVRFEHEDEWDDDSGTFWPERNNAVVEVSFLAHGQAQLYQRQIDISEGIEGFQALLQEILSANTTRSAAS